MILILPEQYLPEALPDSTMAFIMRPRLRSLGASLFPFPLALPFFLLFPLLVRLGLLVAEEAGDAHAAALLLRHDLGGARGPLAVALPALDAAPCNVLEVHWAAGR